jgi:glycosyltransferase involved in cell wall biosynthesis
MMVEYASHRADVELTVVNTAPRWRSIHNNGIFLRVVGGGLQLLRDVVRLGGILTGRTFDAVHLTTSGQLAAVRDLVILYLTAIFGVSFVYHVRFGRIPEIAVANSFEWRIIRRVMIRASMVILIDKATYFAVQRFAPDAKAVLVPNCVNTSGLPARGEISGEVKTALFVGWVIPTKGITELVEAWSILEPKGWRLEIVGPGDAAYQTELMHKFAPINLKFIGELSHADAMARMANCDLFVLPSYTEGFPNVVVEAMALGRPIIATTVGAIPEMLEDDAGILVKCRDTQALVDVLNRLILDPMLCERLGQQAFARAMKLYTIEVVFHAYMKIWREISFYADK